MLTKLRRCLTCKYASITYLMFWQKSYLTKYVISLSLKKQFISSLH
jgi:hypothetical protein